VRPETSDHLVVTEDIESPVAGSEVTDCLYRIGVMTGTTRSSRTCRLCASQSPMIILGWELRIDNKLKQSNRFECPMNTFEHRLLLSAHDMRVG
jgi:hypothetical protein